MNTTAPRLVSDLTVLQRRRLSWRVAKGLSLKKAAKRAGLRGVASEELLTDKSFAALVEAYRSMVAMPEDERHRRLVELAMLVLEEAVIRGDARAALFILAQRTRGRDPADVLAKGVVKALERQPATPPVDPTPSVPPEPPHIPREPACPVDNAIGKAGSMLREELLDEVEKEASVHVARPVRKSRRPRASIKQLTQNQLRLLTNPPDRRLDPAGATPETSPHNPNAPNT